MPNICIRGRILLHIFQFCCGVNRARESLPAFSTARLIKRGRSVPLGRRGLRAGTYYIVHSMHVKCAHGILEACVVVLVYLLYVVLRGLSIWYSMMEAATGAVAAAGTELMTGTFGITKGSAPVRST